MYLVAAFITRIPVRRGTKYTSGASWNEPCFGGRSLCHNLWIAFRRRKIIVSRDQATVSVPDQCLRNRKGRSAVNSRMNDIICVLTCSFATSCGLWVSFTSLRPGCEGRDDPVGVHPLVILLTTEWLGLLEWQPTRHEKAYTHEYSSHSHTFPFLLTDPHSHRKSHLRWQSSGLHLKASVVTGTPGLSHFSDH